VKFVNKLLAIMLLISGVFETSFVFADDIEQQTFLYGVSGIKI